MDVMTSLVSERVLRFCRACNDDEANKAELERRKVEQQRKQAEINNRLENAMLGPRFLKKTFENYLVESDAQRRVLESCRAFLSMMDKMSGMIFCGHPGTGKNHLASAIVREAVVNYNKTALIMTAMDIMRTIKETWNGGGKESAVIKMFVDPDILVIDELGVQFGSQTEEIYFTDIVNKRYNAMRPTLILTNLNPQEVEKFLGARAFDRFKELGRCLLFDWQSMRHRIV